MSTDDKPGPGRDTGIQHAALVVNNGSRILDHVRGQLDTCDAFWFGVAFLTSGGLAQLEDALAACIGRGGRGQVYVSDYNTFTQPGALRELRDIKGIEARLLEGHDYHGKGFLFQRQGTCHLMVGSANLTEAALRSNDELNLGVEADPDSPVVQEFRHRFARGFAAAAPLTDQVIDAYAVKYHRHQEVLGRLPGPAVASSGFDHFEPNRMQVKALEQLSRLREQGQAKALLISATGTGKTVLAALDVRQCQARTMLFVAHRQDIIEQAKATFDLVFRGAVTTGLYETAADAGQRDFLFATTQKLSRAAHLGAFAARRFDYLIVDEAHHATARTYRRILAHFSPGFLLGMTATPERMDQLGKERDEDAVFQAFDNNVAYEIRLHEALESGMLTPFRYFGITKLADAAGTQVDDLSSMRHLPRKDLVAKMITEIKKRRADKMPVRGLVFCSSIEEAKDVNAMLGTDDEMIASIDTSRNKSDGALAAWLNNDAFPDNVNYKFLVAVDKYNEGVDIPRLNQVVMLRPTDSVIVFVQQLGRGLRLAKVKAYLTVLDFIGAHKRNYLIPNALYGYRTRGDEDLREMMTRTRRKYGLPHGCTVEFDEISRQLIFAAIDRRGQAGRELLADYLARKRQLGRIPLLCDFAARHDADPMLFAGKRHGSYYAFLADRAEAGSPDLPRLSATGQQILVGLHQTATNGARGEEPLLLDLLAVQGRIAVGDYQARFRDRFGHATHCPPARLAQCANLALIKHRYGKTHQTPAERHGHELVRLEADEFVVGATLRTELDDDNFKRFLVDATGHAMRRVKDRLGDGTPIHGFSRYGRYTCADIQRLLNRHRYILPRNFTTFFLGQDEHGNAVDCPILVYYRTATSRSDAPVLDDYFSKDGKRFQWLSPRKWRLAHKTVRAMRDPQVPKLLFVRKHAKESDDYLFMGEVEALEDVREEHGCVQMTLVLDQPVEPGLLDYITSPVLDAVARPRPDDDSQA